MISKLIETLTLIIGVLLFFSGISISLYDVLITHAGNSIIGVMLVIMGSIVFLYIFIYKFED